MARTGSNPCVGHLVDLQTALLTPCLPAAATIYGVCPFYLWKLRQQFDLTTASLLSHILLRLAPIVESGPFIFGLYVSVSI